MPALIPTIAGYRTQWLPSDVIAGLTAGSVVIPQAMAYATIAEMPVQAGLYTCIVPMLVYALLGGSRTMSVSTTSTIATLSATTVIAAGVAAGSQNALGTLSALTLLVGAILLVARLLRLGSLVEAINKPTIIGVQIGVGITVALGQLPKLLGEGDDPSGEGFIRALAGVTRSLSSANTATILLAVGSIATLLVIKRWLPRVPGPLIVVVAGILLMALTPLADAGVRQIDAIPRGLPVPALPDFAHLSGLVPGALAISVMVFLESAAVARSLRAPGDKQINSDRELFAVATANVAGSLFAAMPAAGGFSQSAVNRAAGARSQLSAIVTVLLAVLVALLLAPVLSMLPEATLASMVFVAVIGLVDIRALMRIRRISGRDFWLAIVTAALGLTAGLLAAVAAGIVITLGLVLHELNRVNISISGHRDDVLAILIGGPLYTSNILSSELAVLDLAKQHPDVRAIAIDLGRQYQVSVTIIEGLQDLDRELAAAGIQLRLARLQPTVSQTLARTPWYQQFEAEHRVFATVGHALATPPTDSFTQPG
ncbi:SulP family inorganic anion transporter [Cumulibacter soli]|uniref:SulP family inorganic anion transporter n=1 Tax=Cumulibacter soli TaxID=2546344 RepID=UPI0010677945|nr:SulP family inorganic anion transporter [Cumulibacter soli]